MIRWQAQKQINHSNASNILRQITKQNTKQQNLRPSDAHIKPNKARLVLLPQETLLPGPIARVWPTAHFF